MHASHFAKADLFPLAHGFTREENFHFLSSKFKGFGYKANESNKLFL